MAEKGMRGSSVYRYEFKRNLLHQGWRYLLPVAVAVQACFQNKSLSGRNLAPGEYFWRFLEGMPPMDAQSSGLGRFQIPGDWCIFFIMLLYLTGRTAKDFTDGIGMQVLVRTGRVQYLWHAKWTECICNIGIYFASAYVAIGLFCAWQTKEAGAFFIEREQIFIQLFLPALASCVVCIWQMVISLMSNSLLGMLAMCTLLIVSAYFEKWYLIGNYLMKLRIEELLGSGIPGIEIVVFLFGLLAAGIFAGSRVIRSMDYIHARGDW